MSAKDIATHFNIDQCNGINIISNMLNDVECISCDTKTIPDNLKGRGCQCHRLRKVIAIDTRLYARQGTPVRDKVSAEERGERSLPLATREINDEQQWQRMLSKSLRR